MHHGDVIDQLALALHAAASPALAQSLQRYFPKPIAALGVSNAIVTQIARAARSARPDVSGADWLAVAHHFARTPTWHEYLILASALVAPHAGVASDGSMVAQRIEDWLDNHVSNWAQCDDLCIKPLYLYLQSHPECLKRIPLWGLSSSPWRRRASNVALVKFVGRHAGVDLQLVLSNCERLLADPDPYVQKGLGWLLKVAAGRALAPALDFLRQHGAVMERATLRYAVEKLPVDARRAFMALNLPRA